MLEQHVTMQKLHIMFASCFFFLLFTEVLLCAGFQLMGMFVFCTWLRCITIKRHKRTRIYSRGQDQQTNRQMFKICGKIFNVSVKKFYWIHFFFGCCVAPLTPTEQLIEMQRRLTRSTNEVSV